MMKPSNATRLLRRTLFRLVWDVPIAVPILFHAGAQATAEGKTVLPESVLNIHDRADTRKTEQARKMLAEFLAPRPARGVNGYGIAAHSKIIRWFSAFCGL
jgi:hypothetical protein